jgi:hypothetical protein
MSLVYSHAVAMVIVGVVPTVPVAVPVPVATKCGRRKSRS